MSDVLIRDVPDDVLAAIDAKAQRAGLSRTECLRRTLARERSDSLLDVAVEDIIAEITGQPVERLASPLDP